MGEHPDLGSIINWGQEYYKTRFISLELAVRLYSSFSGYVMVYFKEAAALQRS